MPEDSKKNADKKKHDPKEQRKPRHSRNQAGKSDRKAEKIEEKPVPNVTAPQKPVYEDPGPEFYKNLKRETDEIVKITEAESAKYKNKEIQSNWAKYEMPIASYEDLDELDIGADYEKLIQAPLAAGGHFQFKHEKSWDTFSAPSLYDKYFEINMENLSTAISTVPFYQRNDINKSLFSETDILSMNNRASKFKLKYYNDKTYSTLETEAQDRIIKSLKENLTLKDKERSDSTENEKLEDSISELDKRSDIYDVNLDFNDTKTDSVTSLNSNKPTKQNSKPETNDTVDDFDAEYIFKDVPEIENKKPELITEKFSSAQKDKSPSEPSDLKLTTPVIIDPSKVTDNKPISETLPKEHPVASKVNPVIESPEDLEKWLDDFLESS